MDTSIPAVLQEGIDQLSTWTDAKREAFCRTFRQRTEFAVLALCGTAQLLWDEAVKRYFVSVTAVRPVFPNEGVAEFEPQWSGATLDRVDVTERGSSYYHTKSEEKLPERIGRPGEELGQLVRDRVTELIDQLPASQTVIRIIKPEVAAQMKKLSALEARLLETKGQLNELLEDVNVDEFTGKGMLLDDFLKLLKERQREKERKCATVGRLGKEIGALRDTVNKALYKGIPELERATIATVEDLRQKALVLGQLDRKISETVRFGDSEAAMKALEQFEVDEIELAPAVEARFKGLVAEIRSKHGIKAGRKTGKRVGKGK